MFAVQVADGEVEANAIMEGVMKGAGMPDLPLRCLSKGKLEAKLLAEIGAKP